MNNCRFWIYDKIGDFFRLGIVFFFSFRHFSLIYYFIYIFLYYSAAWENPLSFLFVGRYCSLDMLSQTHNNPYTASAFFRCRKKCLELYHVFSSFIFFAKFLACRIFNDFSKGKPKAPAFFSHCRKKTMKPVKLVKWIMNLLLIWMISVLFWCGN